MTHAKRIWVHDLLLVLVLIAATYLRVVGMNWDANQHLHPDERFLTMVETALQVRKCSQPTVPLEACPPDQVRWLGLGDYLDTSTSPLNPQNRGYGFFVYGDFPIVVVRYIAEWVGQTGYDQVNLVGRQVSALSDLLTIVLIYIIAARLYGRRVALLAAAFSALAITQSISRAVTRSLSLSASTRLPGLPTISPIQRTFSFIKSCLVTRRSNRAARHVSLATSNCYIAYSMQRSSRSSVTWISPG